MERISIVRVRQISNLDRVELFRVARVNRRPFWLGIYTSSGVTVRAPRFKTRREGLAWIAVH